MSEALLGSSGDFDEYASLANAEAGVSVDPKTLAGVTRGIMCLADGVLVVKQAKDGTTKTLTMKASIREDIAVIGITAAGSSGCVPIRVYR